MRLKVLCLSAILGVASAVSFAAPAHAGGSACYSVQVTINGSDAVNEAACHELP